MKKPRDSEVLRRRNKRQRAIIRLLKKMHRGGFEPSAYEIGHVDVTIPDLDPAFRGYRIASIADIHLDEWLNPQRFDEVIGLINQQHPDLVAIVGDLFSYEVDGLSQQMVVSLNKLRPKDCSVAVLGNHDHLVGATAVRDVLWESNIIDLSNDVMTVNKEQATLHVAGVDSVALRKHRLDKVLKKLPPAGPAILLAHEPDFADVSASTGRFSLQISGHSHGGQWIVPGIGPPIRGLYSSKVPPRTISRRRHDALYEPRDRDEHNPSENQLPAGDHGLYPNAARPSIGGEHHSLQGLASTGVHTLRPHRFAFGCSVPLQLAKQQSRPCEHFKRAKNANRHPADHRLHLSIVST